MRKNTNIGIVIVLYHPTEDEKSRASSWETIYPTVVVDNTEHNQGIAAAQNIGIHRLLEQGVDYVLLLDQDSCITEAQIEELSRSYESLQQQGVRLAAISPRPYNKRSGQPYPYPCNYVGQHSERYTEVTDLMSSGMLISCDAIRTVGVMEEELFIDGVDSEWCWRAMSKGYRLFVDEAIHLAHMLGLGNRTVAGKTISLTPPYRMYYMYRNYFQLCRRNYVPARWKWHNGIKYMLKAIYYPLFGEDKLAYLRNISRGIRDGLCHNKKTISTQQ